MTMNAQRLWVWIFSLAFLVLSGFNGCRLIDLEDRPWGGEPGAVKSLRAQLDRLSVVPDKVPLIEWHEPAELESPDAGRGEVGLPAKATPDAGAAGDQGSLGPILMGIASVQSLDGRIEFRALIDGQMRAVGQRVGGYLIGKITEQGVLLRGQRGDVFLPYSDPIFSIEGGSASPTR